MDEFNLTYIFKLKDPFINYNIRVAEGKYPKDCVNNYQTP